MSGKLGVSNVIDSLLLSQLLSWLYNSCALFYLDYTNKGNTKDLCSGSLILRVSSLFQTYLR